MGMEDLNVVDQRKAFIDLLKRAELARRGDSNDEEIEALWEVANSAAEAYNLNIDVIADMAEQQEI